MQLLLFDDQKCGMLFISSRCEEIERREREKQKKAHRADFELKIQESLSVRLVCDYENGVVWCV